MSLSAGKRKHSAGECDEEEEGVGAVGVGITGCFADCQGGEGLSYRGATRAAEQQDVAVDDTRWLQEMNFMPPHEEDGRRDVLGDHHPHGVGEEGKGQHVNPHTESLVAAAAAAAAAVAAADEVHGGGHHLHSHHCMEQLHGGRPDHPLGMPSEALGQDPYRLGDRSSLAITPSTATSGSVDSPSLVLNFASTHSLAVPDHNPQDHNQSTLSHHHSDNPEQHLSLLGQEQDDHQELEDIHLDLNNLSEPPPSDAIYQHDHRLQDHHIFAVEAMQELQQGDSRKRKGQWTEERIFELRDLVGKRAQCTPSHRQNSNFWSDLTDSSKTLKIFTKEAIRMKARRLGLLNEDGTARAPVGNTPSASISSASTVAAAGGKAMKAKARGTNGVKELPAQLKQELICALIDRGVAHRQLQALSKKHSRSTEELQAWVSTTLLGIKESVARNSGQCLGGQAGSGNVEPDAEMPAEARTPESSGNKLEWTAERVMELKELMVRAEDSHLCTPSGGSQTSRNTFWKDLAGSSRTLQGFSKEALRMKARRLRLGGSECGEAITETPLLIGVASNLHEQPDDGPSGRNRWTPEQMQELKELLYSRKHKHGSSVVHERGFWISLRNASKTLKGFSNESLRMKARRMSLLDSTVASLDRTAEGSNMAGPASSVEPSSNRRGWQPEHVNELCELLAERQNAGVPQSSNGFWESVIRSSRTLHAFKPDSVRKKVKSMEGKGLLPNGLKGGDAARENLRSRAQREMPLNPAQVKELQTLTRTRLQAGGGNELGSNEAWETLKGSSRTLKNCSVDMIQSCAERLRMQGAFEDVVDPCLSGDLSGGEIDAMSVELPVCFPMSHVHPSDSLEIHHHAM
mmetsp:Transcript_7145/g.20179  ORF Transcript_7145/g.20179 Transcript_7145/m.20179 type:complete len:858 (+) Transcript_7145:172-2745(+)